MIILMLPCYCLAHSKGATNKKARRLILSIGNSAYSDSFWKPLNYADQDAKKFAEFLQNNADPGFDYTDILSSKNPETNLGKDKILDAFHRIHKANQSPRDIVIIYLSGHGTIARSMDMSLKRYYVTYDTSPKDVVNTALSLDLITQKFRSLKSKKKVLILDFCHSGTGKSRLTQDILLALESQKGSYLPDLEDDEVEGEYVLAASGFGQAALESRKLEGGVYTHFLLESFKEAVKKNLAISITEAHAYARKKTFLYTNGAQTPTQISKTVGTDPILLNSNQTNNKQALIYSFWKHLSNLRVFVNGNDKGLLAEGVRIPEGKNHISLVNSDNEEVFINKEINFEPSKEYSALALVNQGKVENWKKLKKRQDQLRFFPGDLSIYDSSIMLLDTFKTLESEKNYPGSSHLKNQLYLAIIKHYAAENRYFKVLSGHQYAVRDVTFNPEYEVFATAGFDHKILIWNLKGELLKTIKTDSFTSSVKFSPDGKYLSSAEYSGFINIWSWNGSKQYLRKQVHQSWVNQITFSPDSQKLATASDDGSIKILKKVANKALWTELNSNTMKHEKGANYITFDPKGSLLASASQDHTAKIWDLKGKLIKTLHHEDWVTHISFDPQKPLDLIATASLDGSAKLWSNFKKPIILNHEGEAVNHVNFSPDGSKIITATDGDYGNVFMWDRAGNRTKGLLREQKRRHFFGIGAAKFDQTGEFIGAISKGRTPVDSDSDKILLSENQFYVWDGSGSPLHSFSGHMHWINQLAFSPNYSSFKEKLAVTTGWNSKVRLWKIANFDQEISPTKEAKKVFFSIENPESFLFVDKSKRLNTFHNKTLSNPNIDLSKKDIMDIAYHASSQTAAILYKDRSLEIWDLNIKKNIFTTKNNHWEKISFTPQGSRLLISSSLGKLHSLDMPITGYKQFQQLYSSEDSITCMAIRDDGELIALGFSSGKVTLLDRFGQQVSSLQAHQRPVFSLGFSPNFQSEQTLVSASVNGEVNFWKENKLIARGKHKTAVHSISINKYGIVASGSADKTIKLWDMDGNFISQFDKKGRQLQFAPNGSLIFVTESRGRVYKMPFDRLYNKLCEDIAYFITDKDKETYRSACKHL